MREYRCRSCGRVLFRSDATYGRVRATCPDRRCRVDQVVHLGGYQPRPEREGGQSESGGDREEIGDDRSRRAG